jgi:hypothetical protein
LLITNLPCNGLESPGFTCLDLKDKEVPQLIQSVLASKHYYDLGSHMGCTCGFSYSTDRLENHEKRLKDVNDCFAYLNEHKANNSLKLFAIMWDEFKENYESRIFQPQILDENEFYFPELQILLIE